MVERISNNLYDDPAIMSQSLTEKQASSSMGIPARKNQN